MTISDLSSHLFWDIDKNSLCPKKNKRIIIQRVLDYGLMNDWKLIKEFYGTQEIANVAVDIRDLDPKSASFISALSKIPIEKFLCYTTTQSQENYWNF